MFSELRWKVIVCYVDIGGIDDHYCLNFLFIMIFNIAHVYINNGIIFLCKLRFPIGLAHGMWQSRNTCVAYYAIFTDWGFLKITICEYPANSKCTTCDLSSDVVYKLGSSRFTTVEGEELTSVFKNEDAANTKRTTMKICLVWWTIMIIMKICWVWWKR